MMGRKNGKSRRRMSRKAKIALYSTFTVLLTSLVVTGYYLVSSGIIFGKFDVRNDTYKLGKVLTYGNPTQDADTGEEIAIDPNKIEVTNQNQEGAKPLTSKNKDLPEIPPCEGEKHSETNPFVILEVVPQLSQQSLSYLVGSPEKGLPFDPVDVSIRFSKEYNIQNDDNKKSYLKKDGQTLIDRQTVQNAIQNCGYIYFTNLFGTMAKADGTDLNYYDVDFIYDIAVKIAGSKIYEEDFNDATLTMSEFCNLYKAEFVKAAPEYFGLDELGKLVVKNESLKKALADDQNWSRRYGSSKKDPNSFYTFSIPLDKIATNDFYSLSISELAKKYPSLFTKDSDGKDVNAAIFADESKWTKQRNEKKDATMKEKIEYITKDSGYFVKVGKGKGKYTLSEFAKDSTNKNVVKAKETGGDSDVWDYVENLENPDPALNINNVKIYKDMSVWDINSKLNQENAGEPAGVYIKLGEEKHMELTDSTQLTIVAEHNSGYLVKVGAGKGKYTLSDYQYGGNNELTVSAVQTGTDTDVWDYVENLENPDSGSNIWNWSYFMTNRHNSYGMNQVINQNNQDEPPNMYITLGTEEHFEPWGSWNSQAKVTVKENKGWVSQRSASIETKTMVVATPADPGGYTFSYTSGQYYQFRYAGLRFNDILRHGLFERDTEEEYEKLNVQVIVVTPDMINEMDANDTPETISYIERADCFYISQYYDGYNEGNNSVAENFYQFANFYNKYCGGDDRTLSQGEHKDLISFDDTDLEWFDCMKILKRISSNAKLPLMWTKLVGGMWQEGLDGSFNSQIYVDPNNTAVDLKSSMNNLAKLYGITIQFDLQATKSDEEKNLSPTDPDYRRTFMDDIYPEMRVMKLNKDQMGTGSKHPAQYTGYWERAPLATGGSHKDDEEYLKRCYYLWDKFTFLPTDITGIYGQNGGDSYNLLVTKYGYLATYLNNSTYSQDSADRNSFQNAYDSRGSAAMSGTDGSDEEADAIGAQNVTVAGSEHTDNQNQSIPRSRSELDRMIDILKKIMGDRGTAPKAPDNLEFNLLQCPKYYIKMSNDTILLDFSKDAKYKANKKIYVKFRITNKNNEDALIQKVSLVSDAAGTKSLEIYKDDTGNSSSRIDIESVKYSNGTSGKNGYRIPAHNSLECYVPVNLKDWQDGESGQKIKVEWVSRMNYVKSDKTLYSQKTGENEVYINERELFNLD